MHEVPMSGNALVLERIIQSFSTHMCKNTLPSMQVYFSFASFHNKGPNIHHNKMISTCWMHLQSPRVPYSSQIPESHADAHLHTHTPHHPLPTYVQRVTGLDALSSLSRLWGLSICQPPLIPALHFLQIKFQLFVNLCENDKPVPELSFNTQKHK